MGWLWIKDNYLGIFKVRRFPKLRRKEDFQFPGLDEEDLIRLRPLLLKG